VNFSRIQKNLILGCDKPTTLKMNLALEIRMDQKRNFKNSALNLSSLSFVILNEPMNLGASLTHTLKCCKAHIGDTLRYTKSSKFNPLRLRPA
jgi:hypothetical protein